MYYILLLRLCIIYLKQAQPSVLIVPVSDQEVGKVLVNGSAWSDEARVKAHFYRPVTRGHEHLDVDVSAHWHMKGTARNRLHEVWVNEEGHVDGVVVGARDRGGQVS